MYYEGQRVRLRPPERAEVPLYTRWMMNPALREYVTVRYISLALEETWFERILEAMRHQPPTEMHFVIEVRDDSTPIGMCGLHRLDWVNRNAEFGIVIGEPDYWGKGYGTDATRTLVDIGFTWFALHRIYLRVIEDNIRAIRAYERAGFKHEGVEREAMLVQGTYKNLLLMSLLASEFKAKKAEEA